MADISNIAEGFLAHLLGGVLGGVVGWMMHVVYGLWRRGQQHAQFDREIVEFANELKSLVRLDEIPNVMKRVVPLASKATFGTDTPPLKEKYVLPTDSKVECGICERSVKPTHEGRCETCKLGLTSYHKIR